MVYYTINRAHMGRKSASPKAEASSQVGRESRGHDFAKSWARFYKVVGTTFTNRARCFTKSWRRPFYFSKELPFLCPYFIPAERGHEKSRNDCRGSSGNGRGPLFLPEGQKKSRRRPTLARAGPALPSAMGRLTSVFGMGTGISAPLWPPA